MRTETPTSPPVLPLLFRTATRRVTGPEIPGNYDPALGVWTVVADGMSQPIITTAEDALLDIRTSTKVAAETDDEEIFADRSLGRLAEIVTKTETSQETDDEHINASQRLGLLAEIVTKTAIQSETDDEVNEGVLSEDFARSFILPELATKTDVQRESDDEISAVGMEPHVHPRATYKNY
ncbi:hypothetical protein [Pseudophaeobacter flagellatus]|uniref:hypothetical protein n=1 Tax=Pseudophaeobacter flagellatus TaxID=2899119 RepID=UPI001E6269DD|nr:hypothetical protein [Pseudophaeobacter flagellatus]MCD9148484.1 hypothetical protein [Pseudophaeobacter flagellatus]